jgi:hypothetical protein
MRSRPLATEEADWKEETIRSNSQSALTVLKESSRIYDVNIHTTRLWLASARARVNPEF